MNKDLETNKGWYKRKYLPHYDQERIYQHITFRLFDSVPKSQIEKWKNVLLASKSMIDDSELGLQIKLQAKITEFEDKGFGNCYLQNSQVRHIVENSLLFFNEKRYKLIEWKIMPNHVHVLIEVFAGENLPKIVYSWKSYTANKCNKILNRKGKFWMDDYYDTFIRNEQHFLKVIEYIRNNDKPQDEKRC